MKRIFITVLAITAFTIASAQTTATDPAQPVLSKEAKEKIKEEKAKTKAKQEEDLTAALKETGLTEDQTKQVRDALAEATLKSNDLKSKTGMDDAAKETEKQKINQDKNAKIKEIMGKEKYSLWNSIRKKQKEVVKPAEPVVPVTKPTGNH
ncbi:MAG: hypothetical protein ABJA78_11970 [Ferruginibacter sp.]